MNPRLTWFLVLVAAALGGYAFWTGRAPTTMRAADGVRVHYVPIDPAAVTAVELLRSNTVVRVERRNDRWRMALPVAYPAEDTTIKSFLEVLGRLKPERWLSAAELAGSEATNSLQAFGLESGATTLKLETGPTATLLKIGGPTAVGNRVYLQRVGTEGVFIVTNSLTASLPRTPDYWRSRSLFDVDELGFDRVEVRGKTPGFEVRKGTNGMWQLTKPMAARADGARIDSLIQALRNSRVMAFLSDAPNVDLEPLGLQPPENEFILGRGANELARIQIGNIPADATNFVRARLPATTNIVLLPVQVGQLARMSLATFRDRQLLPPLTGLTRFDFRAGTNSATLEARGTNWVVTAPAPFPADGDLVRYWLEQLPKIGIADFVNDVVADYSIYGLDAPQHDYRFYAGTNLLVQLQFGKTNGPQHIFARRLDEPGVYSIPLGSFLQQPEAAVQFRDLRFAESNVVKVVISQLGKTRTLERNATGEWAVTAGQPAAAFTPAVEETLHRLGETQSVRYAVPDESLFTRLPSYGRLGHEFTLTLREGAALRTLRLRWVADLGATAVALVHVDGSEPLRIEVPGPLAQDLQREFAAQ